MDFDSIISLLLIISFFVFPSLLKRLSQKKKTGPTQAGKAETGKAKKLSLFEKLGEQIREYVQTLEQEAQKGKQSHKAQEWDHLAEDREFQTYEEDLEPEVYADEPVVEPSVSAAASVIQEKKLEHVPKPEKPMLACDSSTIGVFRPDRLSSCHLQQAIIWSEILSKPVALRQE